MGEIINYQKEVQRVRPYAYGQCMMGYFLIVDGVDDDYSGGEKIGELSGSEVQSWESAYNQLKQKGEIS